MSGTMTRRKVLTAGAASTGLMLAANRAPAAPGILPETSVAPFLSPWSPPGDLKRDLTPGTTPIRLASWSSTTIMNYRNDMSITDMVKRVRDQGYTSTNASVGMFQRNPWLDVPESEIRELKEALTTYDVTFFDMHAYANNIHPDPEERKKIHRHVIEQCEAAERIGCPMVTTQTGSRSPVSAVTIHRDNWTRETWDLSVKAIKQILNDTAGMKVALGIEALNLININNPKAHLQLIEEVADPRCQVCYDPTNQINLGTYLRTTELVNMGFDLLGEHIIAAHAKDTYVLPNRMSAYITQILPGKGMMDYETYLVRLSKLSWSRTLIIEHLKDEDYPAAKKFIEETAAQVGVTIYQ